MEFAYSHHYCNQIKSNYFLTKKTSNVDNYYNYLYEAVTIDQYRLSADYNIKPAMPDKVKFNLERKSIANGLGITLNGQESPKQKNNKETIKALRIKNTSQEMESLERLAKESAINVSNTTSKRAVLRSVRDLVRNAKTQNALDSETGARISKKQQNNARKAFKKFSILFKLDKTDSQANLISFAYNLNKLVGTLNTSLGIRPSSGRVINQKKEVFSALNSQFQQLLTEINDFICENENFTPLYAIYNKLKDEESINANQKNICDGLNDITKYLNNINSNLDTIRTTLFETNDQEEVNTENNPFHQNISHTDINSKIQDAITNFHCNEEEAMEIDNSPGQKIPADSQTGGSRRRIKKRRPSRTRRNKSNLKSKSKTKTRKQKKPKLKRKSKKRKGSSRRRSRR